MGMSSASVNAYLGHIVIRRSTCWKRNRRHIPISPSMALPSTFSHFPKPSTRSCLPRKVGDNFSVCTLNLDHVVQLQQRPDFRAAYRRARFVTADGFPIVVLSRLLGTRIERTTGADLVEPVCREAGKKRSAGFPARFERTDARDNRKTLVRAIQRIEGGGTFCPRLEFRSLIRAKRTSRSRAFAPPARGFASLRSARRARNCSPRAASTNWTEPACCASAPRLDFIAGTQARAPSITQKIGLEWAWRMLREPRRLGAALRALHGRRSAARGAHHSADCQRTNEESGMTSTLTLSLRARNASRAKTALPDLPHSSVRSARRKGRRARNLYPRLHYLPSRRYRYALHRRGFDGATSSSARFTNSAFAAAPSTSCRSCTTPTSRRARPPAASAAP